MQSEPTDLNPKQERFCWEYALGEYAFNATKSYQTVYADAKDYNGAAASASYLLRNPKVAQRIRELRKQAEEAALRTVEGQAQQWLDLVPRAMERLVFLLEQSRSENIQVKAAEAILNRALGLPTATHEVAVKKEQAAQAAQAFAGRLALARAAQGLN